MRKYWNKYTAVVLGVVMAFASLNTCKTSIDSRGQIIVYAAEDSTQEFVIDENGVLTKYNGNGGDVVVPDGVKEIGAQAFFGCKELKSIKLPSDLTVIGTMAFGMCSNLTDFKLPAGITSIEVNAFYSCNALDVKSMGFENCTQLETLYLSSMELDDINILKGCIKLKRLDLSHNGIKDIGSLENLNQLTYLDLTGNQISDVSSLKNCRNLENLNLAGNQISNISSLQECNQLMELNLSGNQISDIGSLINCTNMAKLDLTNNKITDFDQLADLNLSENARILIAGNEIPEQMKWELADKKLASMEGKGEVAVGLRQTFHANNYAAIFADTLSSLFMDSVKVTIQDESIVRMIESNFNYADYPLITIEALKPGSTNITITCGAYEKQIPVNVVEEIAAPDKTADHLPSLEAAYKATALVSWKGQSVWFVQSDIAKKVADIKASDKKYIARLKDKNWYYSFMDESKNKQVEAECLVLDQDQQLWKWVGENKEKIAEDVETFAASRHVLHDEILIAKNNGMIIDSTGSSLLQLEDHENVQGMCTGYHGEYMNHTGYCWLNTGKLYVKSAEEPLNVLDVREGGNTWLYLSEDGHCYQYGDETPYDQDIIDITKIYKYSSDGQSEETFIQTKDGWYQLNQESGERTLTDDIEREGVYHLTKYGDLYCRETKILNHVSDFYVDHGNEMSDGMVYAIRTDGSLWRNEGGIDMPELVNTLEELQNLPDVTVILGDLDGDTKITLTDAQMALKAALKIIVLNDAQQRMADVDGTHGISLTDAQMILKAALKIITL